MKRIFKGLITVAFTLIAMVCALSFSSSAAEGKWITAWSTAPTQIGVEGYDNIVAYVGDITARTVITPTASGTELRVKFSNYYGDSDLVIAKATVAASSGDSGIYKNTLMYLSFDGKPGITIPAGQEVYSDAIPFVTTAGQDIAVSTYLESFSEIKTMGLSGGNTYLTAGSQKDMSDAEDFNLLNGLELDQRIYTMLDKLLGSILNTGTLEIPLSYSFIKVVPALASVEVLNPNENAYSVVVIGDSTVANEYPLYLSQAINDKNITDIGISAKGIIGNRLLGEGLGYGSLIFGESLLDRMKRDIIGLDGKNQSNVKYAVIKIGANDIMHPVCTDIMEMYPGIQQPTAEDIIDGYKKFISFCHDNKIKVIAVSITQWKGNIRDYLNTGEAKYDRTQEEFEKDWQIALDVNKFLSTTSLLDGYVDYIDISANPSDKAAFLPEYTIDGAHPSDTLQKLWAKEFPLSLIGVGKRTAGVTLNKTSLDIYKGDTAKLKATIKPDNATDKSVTWTSSNPKVVKVSSSGKITALKKGTATITVKTKDSGCTAKCKVTVSVKPESISLSGKTKTTYTTGTLQLTAKVSPSYAVKDLIWSSSNKKVAKVSNTGLVTAVGKGTATVTVKSAADKSVKATYKITVKKKVYVQSLNLSTTEKTGYVGKSFTLKTSISPSSASVKDVKWTSSDSKIAKVSKTGKITPLKEGTVVITCRSADNPLCYASCVLTVRIKTTGVKISSELTMYVSQQKALTAKVSPSDATNKKVTWSSSNKKVATVSSSGKITAKKPGKTTITVKTKSGGYKDTCVVTVKKYVPVKSFSLNKKSLTLKDGLSYTLSAAFKPSSASEKGITWSSSNTKVATVSSKGKVIARSPGSCTIKATSKDSGKSVTCKLTVKRVSVKSVHFEKKTYTLTHYDSLQLSPVIAPSNATNTSLKWKSSNPEYVKVSSKGKVTALKTGKTVTITVTTADGGYKAKCKIKVKKASVEAVKLNKSSATLAVGGSVTLSPVFTPAKPTNKKVTWSSSDTRIAKVSENGKVTPLRDGTAVITCTTADGGYKAKCKIKVSTVKVTAIMLDKASLSADKGMVFSLKATVLPADASHQKIIWSSTNKSVATVTSNGKVTTIKEGVCYIKATSSDGKKTATCKITVV